MRVIKFRGYRNDLKGWQYGYYQEDVTLYETYPMIVDALGDNHYVIPESVGQFISTDKDGEDIYEGDILRCEISNGVFVNGYMVYDEGERRFKLYNEEEIMAHKKYCFIKFEKVIHNVFELKQEMQLKELSKCIEKLSIIGGK